MEAKAKLCEVPRCDQIAEIVVKDQEGAEAEVCRDHWHEMLHASSGTIRGVRLLRRPSCFRSPCKELVVAVIADPDGSERPVCQRHWDDLSWVDLPEGVLSDEPGWSRR